MKNLLKKTGGIRLAALLVLALAVFVSAACDDDLNVVTPGTRVRSIILDTGEVIVEGGAVVPGEAVNIATIDFSARGGDMYPYRGAPFTTLGVVYQRALFNYIVDPVVEGGLGGVISAAEYPEGGEGRITTAP